MSADDWVKLITAVAALVGAVGSVINRNHLIKQDVTMEQHSEKIEQIHLATNSMKDDLVAAVKSEATAAGLAEGRAEQKASDLQKN